MQTVSPKLELKAALTDHPEPPLLGDVGGVQELHGRDGDAPHLQRGDVFIGVLGQAAHAEGHGEAARVARIHAGRIHTDASILAALPEQFPPAARGGASGGGGGGRRAHLHRALHSTSQSAAYSPRDMLGDLLRPAAHACSRLAMNMAARPCCSVCGAL